MADLFQYETGASETGPPLNILGDKVTLTPRPIK
jgi:hypothetical protein